MSEQNTLGLKPQLRGVFHYLVRLWRGGAKIKICKRKERILNSCLKLNHKHLIVWL